MSNPKDELFKLLLLPDEEDEPGGDGAASPRSNTCPQAAVQETGFKPPTKLRRPAELDPVLVNNWVTSRPSSSRNLKTASGRTSRESCQAMDDGGDIYPTGRMSRSFILRKSIRQTFKL